ncbi:hydrolase [Mangrovimonas sp. YM274]|uniref:hydrolase n=1 Tax=Mangrovimonas sp. YM274 TaxID=3070660 RepID=UPI0027DE952B|nr:hydrolase [Mangrovimonas sp. YM274]WMI67223.1 hydrolase [Mangrovimonas sp. YM274]
MKSRIFMYLFIFSVLLIVFQYANSKNILDSYEKDIKQLKEKLEKDKTEIEALHDENLELMYFDIENDEDALSYFENKGYDVEELIPFIKDEIYKLNVYEGDDHPLVPYASMTDGKMMINKIKLLNHKWIIADFSDGKYWGQIFLTYEISESEELKFKVVEYFMYPPSSI